ncbi:MAG: arginine--tRNA ligase [Eubacteriales bacterium]
MDFKEQIAKQLSKSVNMDFNSIYEMIEVPKDYKMGDYALPCFKLSRVLKSAPDKIAKELSQNIDKGEYIEKVEQLNGYLNFFLDREKFTLSVLEEIQSKNEAYGSSNEGNGKTICIDYSSINIAKPFHIGHLLTTVIGNALYNIYSFLGYKCVSINHLGDWGTQFGKLIYAYKHWGSKQSVEKGGVNELTRLYVKFHDCAKEDESLEDEARAWFKKIEEKDEEAIELFSWFKEITLKEVSRVYDILGIKFDSYAGESFYNDKMQTVIDELREKNLLELSQGAYVVNLDEYKLPPCLILKKDGATLYSTRDLAAAFYRKKEYNFYKCLYVVAYQQNLHFKQWFKVVEKLGYDWAKDLEHVAFGMVSLEDGTLSTRKGKVVLLEDVLNKAIEKTKQIIEEKNPDISNKEKVSSQVGVGAVIFNALLNNRIKDMVFSWDRALNFDGETGPYVQYTHARCNSVIKKAGEIKQKGDYYSLDNDEAFIVLKMLYSFPRTVAEAKEKNEPSLITRYSVDLSQAFNKYYYEHRIIDEDEKGTANRVLLTKCVKTVIKTALKLIGIEAPDQM